MSSQKRHPHMESPTNEQLSQLQEEKTSLVRHIYLQLHSLILEALPRVQYSVDSKDGVIGYGAHQYGYNGWGVLALAAHKEWVTLMFMKGVDLHDSEGLLEGKGKKMRHVKLRSIEDLENYGDTLLRLIEEASTIYEE